MRSAPSSKERLLSAINLEEPDRIPLCFRGVDPLKHLWRDSFERVEKLAELGVDDKLSISVPWLYHPDVFVKEREVVSPKERYPTVIKEIETPEGDLRMMARKTKDWQFDTLPLVADQLWPRGVEYLVKGREDFKKLPYILYDAEKKELKHFYRNVEEVKKFAGDRVLVEGSINGALNIAMSFCGPTRFMRAVLHDKDFASDLLRLIQDWEMKTMERLLEVGVDMIYVSGCYEGALFFSPEIFRRLFARLIREKVEATHRAHAKLRYYSSLGIMPLLQDYKEIGIDILEGLPPPPEAPEGTVDIRRVKEEIGDAICLWGGLSATLVTRYRKEDVEQAVRDTISILAPGGGFVLSTCGSIIEEEPYDNVITLIKTWRCLRDYPIRDI